MKFGRMIIDRPNGSQTDPRSINNHLPHASKRMRRRTNELGYSLLQLLITVGVVAIVAAFAFFGITSARASIRLSNSVRVFAGYAERARSDAVRRHDTTSIQAVDANSYSVTMDFDGAGVLTTRTFSAEN